MLIFLDRHQDDYAYWTPGPIGIKMEQGKATSPVRCFLGLAYCVPVPLPIDLLGSYHYRFLLLSISPTIQPGTTTGRRLRRGRGQASGQRRLLRLVVNILGILALDEAMRIALAVAFRLWRLTMGA